MIFIPLHMTTKYYELYQKDRDNISFKISVNIIVLINLVSSTRQPKFATCLEALN